MARSLVSTPIAHQAQINSDLQIDMTISKKARRNDCVRMIDSKRGIGDWNERTQEGKRCGSERSYKYSDTYKGD